MRFHITASERDGMGYDSGSFILGTLVTMHYLLKTENAILHFVTHLQYKQDNYLVHLLEQGDRL